jgi:hypothetical protein
MLDRLVSSNPYDSKKNFITFSYFNFVRFLVGKVIGIFLIVNVNKVALKFHKAGIIFLKTSCLNIVIIRRDVRVKNPKNKII